VKLSLIICTFNGAGRIAQTLTGIANLQLNSTISAIELIVVNNASTDSTSELVSDFFQRNNLHFPCKLVDEQTKGLIYARMKGLSEAKHPWVLFCDDDNVLEPDYLLQAALVVAQNSGIGAIGGLGIPKLTGPIPTWFDQHKASYAVGPQATRSGRLDKGRHLYGAGLMVKKSFLELMFSAGIRPLLAGRSGQGLTAGDDLELCYLVSLAGGELWYEEKMKFYHIIPPQRLDLEYYHRLVLGHASTEGLLFTYQKLLQRKKLSITGFEIGYLQKLLLSGAVLIKHSLIRQFRGDSDFGYRLNKTKFDSFLNYRIQAKQQFKSIRKAQVLG
jgi:glycosyltransferase involved in cell wall biosynthesis